MKTHVFRGKRYKILQPHTKNWWGETDDLARTLKIARNQDDKQRLDTLIHEGLHAAIPDLDESCVFETARDLATFILRDGWERNGIL